MFAVWSGQLIVHRGVLKTADQSSKRYFQSSSERIESIFKTCYSEKLNIIRHQPPHVRLS